MSQATRGNPRRDVLRLTAIAVAMLATVPWVFETSRAAGTTAAERAKDPIVPPSPTRLADGRPNWTGFWAPVGGMLEINIGLGGIPAKADAPPGSDHLRRSPFSKYSTLKSPYKEKLDKFTADAAAGKDADPVALCFPPGMPRMMVMVYGMELLQTPGQITITSEWQAESRRIWLNQSKHPPAEELDPTYAGHSIGHWEGDTLVVDTVGIREDVPVNYAGLPHGPALHIVERFTSKTPGLLVDDLTIDDPDAFVAPWKEEEIYRYRPDLHLQEFECLENNRNVGPQGEAQFPK
jgi:hypothetical protein